MGHPAFPLRLAVSGFGGWRIPTFDKLRAGFLAKAARSRAPDTRGVGTAGECARGYTSYYFFGRDSGGTSPATR